RMRAWTRVAAECLPVATRRSSCRRCAWEIRVASPTTGVPTRACSAALSPGVPSCRPSIESPEARVMRADTAAQRAPAAVTDAAVAKLNEAAAGGGYWNPDLAPVPPSARRWVRVWDTLFPQDRARPRNTDPQD